MATAGEAIIDRQVQCLYLKLDKKSFNKSFLILTNPSTFADLFFVKP